MPNRIIKESICTSEEIDILTPEQEVFFYRLMVVVDDFGLMDARLSILKAKCYPLKSIEINCIQMNLARLQEVGLVKLYQADGKPYLSIVNWAKHQQIRAKRAKYPTPECGSEITCNQLKSNVPVIQSNPILSLSGNPDPVPAKSKKQTFNTEAAEVLAYLNQVCGSRFQAVAANINLITARLREGATVADMKAVIDRQHAEWATDDVMRKYLRPETLFNASKFASYVGVVGITDNASQPQANDAEWAKFEQSVRTFRATVWPAGMESEKERKASELQAIADSFGVKFERPLMEAAA